MNCNITLFALYLPNTLTHRLSNRTILAVNKVIFPWTLTSLCLCYIIPAYSCIPIYISESFFSVRGSNSRALKVACLTTLACLLLGSQVFTAYMVFGQRQQIRELQGKNERMSKQMTRSSQGKEMGRADSPWWRKSGRKFCFVRRGRWRECGCEERKWELCFLGLFGRSWPSCVVCPFALCLLGPPWGQDWPVWAQIFFVCLFVFNCSSSKDARADEQPSNDEGLWSWWWPQTHRAQSCESFPLPGGGRGGRGGSYPFLHAVWSNGSFSDYFFFDRRRRRPSSVWRNRWRTSCRYATHPTCAYMADVTVCCLTCAHVFSWRTSRCQHSTAPSSPTCVPWKVKWIRSPGRWGWAHPHPQNF